MYLQTIQTISKANRIHYVICHAIYPIMLIVCVVLFRWGNKDLPALHQARGEYQLPPKDLEKIDPNVRWTVWLQGKCKTLSAFEHLAIQRTVQSNQDGFMYIMPVTKWETKKVEYWNYTIDLTDLENATQTNTNTGVTRWLFCAQSNTDRPNYVSTISTRCSEARPAF